MLLPTDPQPTAKSQAPNTAQARLTALALYLLPGTAPCTMIQAPAAKIHALPGRYHSLPTLLTYGHTAVTCPHQPGSSGLLGRPGVFQDLEQAAPE